MNFTIACLIGFAASTKITDTELDKSQPQPDHAQPSMSAEDDVWVNLFDSICEDDDCDSILAPCEDLSGDDWEECFEELVFPSDISATEDAENDENTVELAEVADSDYDLGDLVEKYQRWMPEATEPDCLTSGLDSEE